ncbi:MAG TPA: YhcH/YjgK/YiaL family protein [Rectinemataceae bacterium]|nr:YhcH/YjgK/YiaL family protein [Rectinemataceae bacterium]
MICDVHENWKLYAQPGSRLGRALAWLGAGKAEGLAPGRYEIEGSDIFALVQEYESKPLEACRWEAHRRYIDIQWISRGQEYIDWAALVDCRLLGYQEEKDFQDCSTEEGLAVAMKQGRFLVLFPEDAHRPGRARPSPQAVRKIVLKVRVD